MTCHNAYDRWQNKIKCCRWLIAIAFWLAGGFIKSGLGNRIAYSIVKMFGRTTLGLTYSLVLAEGLLSPAIPSVAARAGGIFFPLAKALCLACGSDPEKGTASVMGGYVMKVWRPLIDHSLIFWFSSVCNA
jgi:di/tricarboxylate transporter